MAYYDTDLDMKKGLLDSTPVLLLNEKAGHKNIGNDEQRKLAKKESGD